MNGRVPSIVKMCRWMEVSARASTSGGKRRNGRPRKGGASRADRDEVIRGSDGTFGYRRVHADLAAWGVWAGPELVRSVMRELGLEPCQPKPWLVQTDTGDGQEHAFPTWWRLDFTADTPGQKWSVTLRIFQHGRAGFTWRR